jgi:hypothetical protein
MYILMHSYLYLGIASKVEYLKELGIKAVWISPFFKSPMVDNGYDVQDYKEIGSIIRNIRRFQGIPFEDCLLFSTRSPRLGLVAYHH